MELRTICFTITGQVDTKVPENCDYDMLLDIQDRVRESLQQLQLKDDENMSFYLDTDIITVTIETPKSEEIKKQEIESINKLADCFKSMGLIPTIGVFNRSDGEFPAILTLNGIRSPRYEYIAYADYDFYNLVYELCVAPYECSSKSKCRTLTDRAIEDFDYTKIAQRVKTNLVAMGLLST